VPGRRRGIGANREGKRAVAFGIEASEGNVAGGPKPPPLSAASAHLPCAGPPIAAKVTTEPGADRSHRVRLAGAFAMTYATKQLTQALQELTARKQEDETTSATEMPKRIPADRLLFSKEVESYLERKKAYSERTRGVSVGSY
jgi:hypothetical protein